MKKHILTLAAIASCAFCLTVAPKAKACEPAVQRFALHGQSHVIINWDPCGRLTYALQISEDGENWDTALDFGEGIPPSQPVIIVRKEFFPAGPVMFVRLLVAGGE